YKALTLSHTATPALPSVSEVRAQAIDVLIRIYHLAGSVDRKLAVIGSLTGATRTEVQLSQSEDLRAMFVRGTVKVLEFFERLTENDDLEVVQKIEHNTYWIFVHAISEDIRNAALNVRARISHRTEYAF